MAQQIPQLFGVMPTGLSPIIQPTSAPSPTSFIFALPPRSYSHIAVFILPGITLPPNTAAAVYIQLPATPQNPIPNPGFKFLGGIGPGKESAIFKVSGLVGGGNAASGNASNGGEVDMDAPDPSSGSPPISRDVTLGISLESAESVSSQMLALSSSKPSGDNSLALVVASRSENIQKPDTVKLAQKIIKNAFNFLASFSGNLQNGVEVVPLKAFEEWWKKFESRVRSDPSFLERDSGD